jgi:hypothetical protein
VLSLSSIAGWEDGVLASIAGAHGTMDERDVQIERSGLYGEYPAILHSYLELFADAPSSLEALKRAVFLLWRAAMASPADSGIAPLPDSAIRVVIDELDALVRRNGADAELRAMLGWYHARSPFLLELYGASEQVLRMARDSGEDAWRRAPITPGGMSGRGQMGRYWSELAISASSDG